VCLEHRIVIGTETSGHTLSVNGRIKHAADRATKAWQRRNVMST
jgi:hypothetical protein